VHQLITGIQYFATIKIRVFGVCQNYGKREFVLVFSTLMAVESTVVSSFQPSAVMRSHITESLFSPGIRLMKTERRIDPWTSNNVGTHEGSRGWH